VQLPGDARAQRGRGAPRLGAAVAEPGGWIPGALTRRAVTARLPQRLALMATDRGHVGAQQKRFDVGPSRCCCASRSGSWRPPRLLSGLPARWSEVFTRTRSRDPAGWGASGGPVAIPHFLVLWAPLLMRVSEGHADRFEPVPNDPIGDACRATGGGESAAGVPSYREPGRPIASAVRVAGSSTTTSASGSSGAGGW